MDYYPRVLITIVCEAVLEDQIVEEAKQHGVLGYTALEARGKGHRGDQSGDFEYNKNIKLEFLCKADTADALCEAIRTKFFPNYAAILYKSDVSVLREDKFT